MPETDRQTDKSSRWAFTAYQEQYGLLETVPDFVAEWGWQDEICPETQRKHRQGYLRTHQQVRFSRLRKEFPGIHFEVAKNWEALKSYCKKEATKDPSGNVVVQVNERKFLKFHEALIRIAEVYEKPQIDGTQSLKECIEEAFWKAVRVLIRIHPADISLYSNPQILRAWYHTYPVWLEIAESARNTQIRIEEVPDSPTGSAYDKMLDIGIDVEKSSCSSS